MLQHLPGCQQWERARPRCPISTEWCCSCRSSACCRRQGSGGDGWLFVLHLSFVSCFFLFFHFSCCVPLEQACGVGFGTQLALLWLHQTSTTMACCRFEQQAAKVMGELSAYATLDASMTAQFQAAVVEQMGRLFTLPS